jgi:PadR family transcriptional regulator, regulatory protein AphA
VAAVTREQQLPATAHVVLGLVSIRPMSGYELAAYAERSIGNFFTLTRSHIYSELDRLGRLGLLEATEIAQENAPTKRVYEITPAGIDELQRWLEGNAAREERSRNLFLVRIFFGDRLPPGQLAALLDDFELAARFRRDQLAAIAEKLADRPGSVFRRSTALFGLRREQANLDWVAEVRPMLLAASAVGARTPDRAGVRARTPERAG